MKYRLIKNNARLTGEVVLESSKSECNRALIINALAGGVSTLHNLSNARDSKTLCNLLQSQDNVLDVKDAGTTMRFLTAYLAVKGAGETLTGSERMKERPIWPLVDALRGLGASIEYLENEGYPPIKVWPIQTQLIDKISIPGNISSQYISALLMIAPILPKGLMIEFTTEIVSRPYIEMTLDLMRKFGARAIWEENTITVPHQAYTPTTYSIEGDWSGASYWYSFVAMGKKESLLFLPGINTHSSQGDKVVANLMYHFGVSSHFEDGKMRLLKGDSKELSQKIDFRDCPDIAQTVMVVAAASGITLEMTGLESLRIKETDRIEAMRKELAKIGAMLYDSMDGWVLVPSKRLPEAVEIETYQDHRMAMAFAPLCQLMNVIIDHPGVVEKSYPGFWDEVRKLGIAIQEIPT